MAIGQRGKFELIEELGRSATGVIYRARQPSLGRDVLVKDLPPGLAITPAAKARFDREIKLVAQIGHPNLVHIIDVGEQEGHCYVVMENVPGRTLTQLLSEKGALSVREAVKVATQVAAALGCIHNKGFTHCAVEPSNIFVDDELNVKLTDFGVALLAGRPEGEGGAVLYASPEQRRKTDQIEPPSDIYSLGLVICEMLSGKRPWEGGASVPPLRQVCKDAPPTLEAVVARCLLAEPGNRYPNGVELRKELQRALLVADAAGLSQEPIAAGAKPGTAESGMFYVDTAAQASAAKDLKLKGVVKDLLAGAVDAHKEKRQALGKLAADVMAMQQAYESLVAEMKQLTQRAQQHAEEAVRHKEASERAVAAGDTVQANLSAGEELKHKKLALESFHQAKAHEPLVLKKKEAWDALQAQLNHMADELALLDAESQRAGQLVPSASGVGRFADAGQWLKWTLVGILSLYVAYRLISGLWTAIYLYGRVNKQQKEIAAAKAAFFAPVEVKLQEGLVLYYSFDQDMGSKVTDDSGKGNEGLVYHGSFTPEGHVGGAFVFDGRSYIDAGDLSAIESRAHLSWGAWIYPTEKHLMAIMGKSLESNEFLHSTIDLREREITAKVFAPDGEVRKVVIEKIGRPNKWQHVFWTYDGERIYMYYNGALQWWSLVYEARATPKTDVHFAIGDAGLGRHMGFVGKIDEVRIYDRTLASNEVWALYNQAAVEK